VLTRGGERNRWDPLGHHCPLLSVRVLTTYVGKLPLRESAPSIFPLIVENRDCAEFGYGAVCHGLGRFQGYFHGENRAGARGQVAITQSCHKASDVTRVDHHLVWWPVWNSLEIKVMSA
jgi:hypothetical protein